MRGLLGTAETPQLVHGQSQRRHLAIEATLARPPAALRMEEGAPEGVEGISQIRRILPIPSITIQQKKYHKGCVFCPATTPTDKPTSSP